MTYTFSCMSLLYVVVVILYVVIRCCWSWEDIYFEKLLGFFSNCLLLVLVVSNLSSVLLYISYVGNLVSALQCQRKYEWFIRCTVERDEIWHAPWNANVKYFEHSRSFTRHTVSHVATGTITQVFDTREKLPIHLNPTHMAWLIQLRPNRINRIEDSSLSFLFFNIGMRNE